MKIKTDAQKIIKTLLFFFQKKNTAFSVQIVGDDVEIEIENRFFQCVQLFTYSLLSIQLIKNTIVLKSNLD